jgi:signal peptidase
MDRGLFKGFHEGHKVVRTVNLIVRTALALVCGLAAMAFVLLAIGPRLDWFRPLTVLSGSMRPTFSPGDLILVRPQPLDDVRVGQVLSFRVPVGAHQVQTHRVIELVRGGAHPIVRTQGDANTRPDPYTAELHGEIVWRQTAVIPYAGYAIHTLRRPELRRPATVVAPVLIALLMLLDLWRKPSTNRRESHANA